MKNKISLLLIVLLVNACSIVPLTGRKQLSLLPASQMNQMAIESYGSFLKSNPLSTNQNNTATLKKVGNKLKNSVIQYLTSQGQQNIVQGFNWEFNLVKSPKVNAWAMPGGKIVFYDGIMDICKNESGVAVVMSHEIAHIIARHGNERMSQGLLTQLGGVALTVALKEQPTKTQDLFMGAYGLGSQVGVLLPFSRKHELEADKIGLIFMAMAGYNPADAIDFWVRMDKLQQGQSPPEFLSTHPSHESRINAMKAFLPEALTYRK